jgi:N-acetylglutamate synthase-like GNAT family acetyltransferase/two-component sensor histidine kinase
MEEKSTNAIYPLTPELEERIQKNPLLHIDTFIIPSPYVKDSEAVKDYDHSYVWIEEGEILGFLLVYADRQKKSFNIYKLVTSPFGRGRGIGTLFIEHLAHRVDADATVYLYLWEKQTDTLEFFQNKGFELGETTVYRNLIYYHLYAQAKEIVTDAAAQGRGRVLLNEEIGKTRHDARKTIRLLSHMVDMLSVENCGKIIEDINRETTTLVNTLNAFRDNMSSIHEVNIKDLIVERIIPYIEASSVPCTFRLSLDTDSPVVLGYYVNFGRALVNMISNSLEAISEAGHKGLITIEIQDNPERENEVVMVIGDNGLGISEEMLMTDEHGYPAFVGNTTKDRKAGEGLGTIQIYSTFGPDNITVDSTVGEGTIWTVRFRKPIKGQDKWYARLERRYNELRRLYELYTIGPETSRTEVIAFIWQLRKMEIFLFDLILQFSKYHNIRSIFRTVLSFLMHRIDEAKLREEVEGFRCDNGQLKDWFLDMTTEIGKRLDHLHESVDVDEYRGALFKSYGQAIENVMIFTLDPETGHFLATDRKLAEHLDFVPYLGKDKETLIRGEFVGDMNNHNQPIFFGVWSIVSDEDLMKKLRIMRKGARTLMEVGIHEDKKLSFYQTTYIRHSADIDSDKTTTFGEFAELSDEQLRAFIREADDEMLDYMVYQD